MTDLFDEPPEGPLTASAASRPAAQPTVGPRRLRDDPTCVACAAWAGTRVSGLYVTDCEQCVGRNLAGSLAAWRAVRGETAVDLTSLIEAAWGTKNRDRGRRVVWSWVNKLKPVGGGQS